MTISQRLAALVAFSSAGLLCVAGVSYVAVTSVQSELKALTSRATPLQTKTYELQERTERLVGSLLKLTLTQGRDEIDRLVTSIDTQGKELARLRSEIQAIDARRQLDFSDFHRAQADIRGAVDKRVADDAAYRAETDRSRVALVSAEKAVAAIRASVSQIATGAGTAADEAQESIRRLGHSLKNALSAQMKLKEIALLVGELDAVTNRFRVSPIRERMRAAADAIGRLEPAGAGDDSLNDLRAALTSVQNQLFRDGTGLLALRVAMLQNTREADAGYAKLRPAVLTALDEQAHTLNGVTDTIEVEAAKHRRRLEAALKLRNEPGGVVTLSEEVALGMREMAGAIRLLMLASTDPEAHAAARAIGKLVDALNTQMPSMRASLVRMGRPELVRQVDSAVSAMAQVAASVDQVVQAKRRLIASETLMRDTLATLKQVAERQSQAGEREVSAIVERQRATTVAVDRRVESSLMLIVSISLAIIVAAGAVGLRTQRLVRRRLSEAMRVAEAVSRGDLVAVPSARGNDETSRVLAALGTMVDTLTEIVRKISAASLAINRDADEIGRGNQELSVRTEDQAARLRETTHAAARLTEIIEHNVEAAREAMVLAEVARDVATRGGAVIADVVATMTDIHASSARVAQITAVIDSMAFETNLLALNAAVEAARAGDHGRGFAVVASEVRALAQKSAEAAGTIRRIVDESAGRAERGTQRVDAAGKTMTEIVEQVGKVTALITQMSSGSDEQFASVERVNAAVRTLDAMTQRNSAVAEQSTVAARMLLDQAVGLADAVSAFRLERGDPGPRSAPPVGRGVPVVKEAIAA